MAGSAMIGALRVDLGLNSAQFQAGAKKAQSTLGTLGASFRSFAVGAIGALSFAAVTTAIKSVIDKADELGKLSQKIGIPVEALSKLEYAAKLADVSLGQLQVGVGRLSKSMGEIAGGKSNDAGKALAAIGVSATDANGKLRPTEEVIADIAEKFAGLKDGAGKTAIAMALFGKSGADLIPLLNAGKQGLADSAAEAEKFGVVIGGPAAKAAEEFNDNLTRLQEAGAGLLTQAVLPLLPRLVELTNTLVDLAKNNQASAFFEELSDYIATTSREAQKLGILLMVMQENFTQADGMTAALERWKAGFEEIRKINESVGKITANADSLKTLMDGVDTAINPKPELADAPIIQTTEKVKKLKTEFDKLKEAGDRVWEGTRTPIETYQLEIRNLNELLAAGTIDHDTYARAVEQLQDGFAKTGDAAKTLGQELAQTLGSTIKGWFDSAIDGTFKFKDALSDLLSQLAKVSLNNAFASLLGGAANPVQGGGFMGGIAKLFGFAQGGSFQVGGSGGIDSQLVAFKASPNERVSVTKPGQDRGGGGVTVNVSVNAPNADGPGLASVRAQLQHLQTSLPALIKNTVTGEKARNPRFAT